MNKKDRDLMKHLNEPQLRKYVKKIIDGGDTVYHSFDGFMDVEIFWSSLDKKYAIFFWLHEMKIIQRYLVDFENVENTIEKFMMLMEKALIEVGEG